MTLTLESSAFRSGADMPERFTGDGEDASPPLAWSGAPSATRSFAIVCSDADAPGGTWYHWAIFDIPRSAVELAEHHPPSGGTPLQALNDFGKPGYGGPLPPAGHGPHRSRFRLYALDVERLGLPAKVRCRDVERAAEAHGIARADLFARYSR